MIRNLLAAMNRPLLSPMLAASLAATGGVRAGVVDTRPLPPVPDAHGFAGAFSGVLGDRRRRNEFPRWSHAMERRPQGVV